MSLFSPHSGNQLMHTLEARIESLISLGEDISKLTNTSENRSLLKWSTPLTTDGTEYTFNLGTIPPSSIQGPNSIQYFDTNTGVIANSGSYMFWIILHTVDSYSDLNMNLAVKLEDDTLVQKGCKLSSPLDYFRTEPSGGSDDYYTYTHQHSHIMQITFPVPKYWKVVFSYEVNSYVTTGGSPSMNADIYMLPID